jgi:hypothetical protein
MYKNNTFELFLIKNDGYLYNITYNIRMYSYNVFPLGVLTIGQIDKGQAVLDDISRIVNDKNNNTELLSLSNKFFTLIPHISKKLKVIKTREEINEKNELLEYMRSVSNKI